MPIVKRTPIRKTMKETNNVTTNKEKVTSGMVNVTQVDSENIFEEALKGYLGSKYNILKTITEEGEYSAEILRWERTDYGDKLHLMPYRYEGGRRIDYEEVNLRFRQNCPEWTAEAKFLRLFAGARHWGDIQGRIVGIKIKFNTKNDVVYKNVVDVFVTDEDDLIFDDEHIVGGVGGTLRSKDEKAVSEEEDITDTSKRRKTKYADLLEDEDEEDTEELEEDFEEETDEE